MAFEDELEQRRAQREAQRQQRLMEHKKLMFRLGVAGAALVALAVLIIVMALSAPAQPDPTVPTTAPTVEPTTEATTAPTAEPTAEPSTDPATDPSTEPPTEPTAGETSEPTASTPKDMTVIHFAAAGDVNINDATAALDFQLAFRNILPLLSGADLTAVNFEGNLIGAPYGSASQSAPQELMTALKACGVDLIQMANSRSIANGLDGLRTTLSAIRAAGMEPVGAWGTAEEAQRSGGYTIREVNGVRVAIVAFTKGMDSMALPVGSESCVNVLYEDYATTYKKVNTKGITAVLERVAREKPDITIALVHWGSEFRDQISSTQSSIRRLMLENGVDAIIGTHPHYVQALEFDKEAGTLVAYSLGDLLSDGETPGTEYSIVLDLEITKDHISGETKITSYSYTPIFNVRWEDRQLQVMELQEAIRAYESGYLHRPSKDMYEDMLYALTRVEERMKPET